MLSQCFNNLFSQLQTQRINLDALLLTWLTLSDEAGQDEASQAPFDASRVPSIPLNLTAVTSLLAALAWSPSLPIRTWVLAFQTLTLTTNLKYSSTSTRGSQSPLETERSLAGAMISDKCMMTVLVKFLSAAASSTSNLASHQNMQASRQ